MQIMARMLGYFRELGQYHFRNFMKNGVYNNSINIVDIAFLLTVCSYQHSGEI